MIIESAARGLYCCRSIRFSRSPPAVTRPMSIFRRLTAAAALAVIAAACDRVPSGAGRKSQPALVVQRRGAARLAGRYNRPSARGRRLFGGIVPWDSVWCPGADEATRLDTTRDLSLGRAVLPKGAYSLWM